MSDLREAPPSLGASIEGEGGATKQGSGQSWLGPGTCSVGNPTSGSPGWGGRAKKPWFNPCRPLVAPLGNCRAYTWDRVELRVLEASAARRNSQQPVVPRPHEEALGSVVKRGHSIPQ